MGASPMHMPMDSVHVVMSSPQWAAAGSDVETEELTNNEQKTLAGMHKMGSEPDVKGQRIPRLVKTASAGDRCGHVRRGFTAAFGGTQHDRRLLVRHCHGDPAGQNVRSNSEGVAGHISEGSKE